MQTSLTGSVSEQRIQFFDLLFANHEGYLCIGYCLPAAAKSSFKQKFFVWPDEILEIERFVSSIEQGHDVYFCVNMLDKAQRRKEFCKATNLVWADLDDANPAAIDPPPPILWSTSPGRWQAVWRLETKVTADQAEEISKRVAYGTGADKSGWGLTKLLRVPGTTNFKYAERPSIEIHRQLEILAPIIVFDTLPTLEKSDSNDLYDYEEMPDPTDLPDPAWVIYKYRTSLQNTAFQSIYTLETEQIEDWSSALWRLIHECLEVGMDKEETLAVVRTSPVNKYDRDNRPPVHLWRDIQKAYASRQQISVLIGGFRPLTMPDIAPEPATDTFITTYSDWATEATDAIPVYHELSAFIMLSAIVSNSVRLETDYGMMVPNLWGLVLGDSTLTRKTTAMKMAIELLGTIDREIIVATEGSAEGLLTSLEQRPNKASIFFKDEVSGFFNALNKREYLAGMTETLTALYDVPPFFTRRLRKETISLENPIFIFFGGGVKEPVYATLNEDYVLSGFLPRFLVVSGNTDLNRIKPTGPPTAQNIRKKQEIADFVADLYERYASPVIMKVGGESMTMPPRIRAVLTSDAWRRYQNIEAEMVERASTSAVPLLALPTFERLSRSMLKMALILAATRQYPTKDNQITVVEADVINAAYYAQQWGEFSIELILNAGKRASEKVLEKIIRFMRENPGVLRSTVMQHMHLSKREADDILSTLEDRQLVKKEKRGRGWAYWAS